MKRSTTTPERLLTVAEIAECLSLSKKSIYRLIDKGKLPVSRCGRSIRIQPKDLENFINGNRV